MVLKRLRKSVKQGLKRAVGRKPSNGAHSTQHAVEQFLYRQADLLDSKRWEDWIGLFTDDGQYHGGEDREDARDDLRPAAA